MLKKMDLSNLNCIYVKRLSFLLVFLIFVSVSVSRGQARASWYHFDSSAEGFSAKFPVKPKLETENNSLQSLNRYQAKLGSTYFEVGHIVMRPGFDDLKAIFSAMEELQAANIKSFKGQIVSKKDIFQSGCHGEELVGKAPQVTMHIRFFASGQNVYILLIGFPAETAATQNSRNYFFNSFSVKGGCTDKIGAVTAEPDTVKDSNVEGTLDVSTGWRKINSDENGFEVLVPARASLNEEQIGSPPFAVFLKLYLSKSGDSIYFVRVLVKSFDGFKNMISYEALLNTQESSLITELTSTYPAANIKLDRKINIGKYPGREYSLDLGSRIGRARMFTTPHRSYLFIYSDSKENYSPANSDRFFNSIKVSLK